MKVSYNHLLKYIKSRPSIKDVSECLFQLGHENEIQNGIIDIEITPNRGDCLSLNGLLRELSIFFEIDKSQKFFTKEIKPLKLSFKNEAPNICKNISFLQIDIEKNINDYSGDLADYFNDLKLKKNNFFTDISNFLSYETGQPTHCYDYEKIDTNEIIFREINYDTEFETLLDTKIDLVDSNPVFISSDKIINLAGIMGGKNTACSDNTRSVLIECAYFNPKSIIGKTVKYDLQSDAAYKFERNVDRECHDVVLRRFISIVEEHTRIKNIQIYKNRFELQEQRSIAFDIAKFNKILGHNVSENKARYYLERLGFSFLKNNFIGVPSYRNDIFTQNDIAEELARCIGYNNIKSKEIKITNKEELNEVSLEENLSKYLIDNGFFEVISYPFTKVNNINSISIDNPIDKNRNFLRTDMRHSLVHALLYNERRQKDSIKLFEVSNFYSWENDEKKVVTDRRIGIIASGRIGKNYLNFSKKIDESYLNSILSKFFKMENIQIFQISRDEIVSKKKDKIFYVEINILNLPDALKKFESKNDRPKDFVKYKKISEQPFSSRDLSFSIIDVDDIKLLETYINNFSSDILVEKFMFDFFKNDKTDQYKIGYRFIFQSQDVTIKESEVDDVINDIIANTIKIKTVKIPGLNL